MQTLTRPHSMKKSHKETTWGEQTPVIQLFKLLNEEKTSDIRKQNLGEEQLDTHWVYMHNTHAPPCYPWICGQTPQEWKHCWSDGCKSLLVDHKPEDRTPPLARVNSGVNNCKHFIIFNEKNIQLSMIPNILTWAQCVQCDDYSLISLMIFPVFRESGWY